MPEMILPGTYIEVRAEGLIVPGPISISNVGIVGTARRGKLADPNDPDTVYTPADIGEARQIFGPYDAYEDPEEPSHPLTLIRAMELLYANGAQRVFAVRVAADGAAVASYALAAGGGNVILNAVAPGSGYNDAELSTGPYSGDLGLQVIGAGGTVLETLDDLPQDPGSFASKVDGASGHFSATNASGDAPIAVDATASRTTDGADASAAIYALSAGSGRILFTANEAGTGMNGASIDVADGSAADNCTVTIDSGTGTTETWNDVPRDPSDFIDTLNGDNGAYDYEANASSSDSEADLAQGSALFAVSDDGADADVGNQSVSATDTDGADARAAVFSVPAGTGSVQLTARTPGAAANSWNLTLYGYLDVTFEVDQATESWRDVPSNPAVFARVINGQDSTYNYGTLSSTGGGSNWFEADAAGATGSVAAEETAAQPVDGSNGASADPDDYETGLNALLNQDVHIVVLAGQGGSDMESKLSSHVENASTDLMRRERIGVIGSVGTSDAELVPPTRDDGRMIFVAPGIKVFDPVASRQVPLPGTYAAAAVAGRISSLDPHFSPTNKTINASGLATEFNGTELEQLVLGRVLALEVRTGAIRIVRGITTSSNTAWAQITTRRIVDYARFGVRAASNPFIGKLNNERVRQALKGSINSLLADMVDREMLISYELDVSATREQQIRGIAQVTMVLRPTFSIDYIRVVMYLE